MNIEREIQKPGFRKIHFLDFESQMIYFSGGADIRQFFNIPGRQRDDDC